MSKKDEALKLALEALEIGHEYAVETAEHFHIEMAGYKQHRHDAMDAEVKQIADAITAIRDALAEQPAQQWNAGVPPLYPEPEPGVSIKATYEQPAQQQDANDRFMTVVYRNVQEDDAKSFTEHPKAVWFGWCHAPYQRDEARYKLEKVSASPPASKPLTDEQITEHFKENVDTGSLLSFADGVRFAEAAHGIGEKK